jgi:excisionase family DNA binding protein
VGRSPGPDASPPSSKTRADSAVGCIVPDVTELPPTVTVEHAARLLGVSRSAAYRAAAKGQLPTIALGRRLLVPTRRLLELLGLSVDEGQ